MASLACFHPDNLSFGDGIYLSPTGRHRDGGRGRGDGRRPGGSSACTSPTAAHCESGVLAVGSMEIAQLDNDPDFPENGRIELIMRGGR